MAADLRMTGTLCLLIIVTTGCSGEVGTGSTDAAPPSDQWPNHDGPDGKPPTTDTPIIPPAEGDIVVPVLSIAYFPASGGNLDPAITGMSTPLTEIQAKVTKIEGLLGQALNAGSRYRGYKDPSPVPSLSYTIHESKVFNKPVPVVSELDVLIDGDPESGKWHPSPPYAGDYVQIDLGSTKTLSSMTLYFWFTDRPEQYRAVLSSSGQFGGEQQQLFAETQGLSGYSQLPGSSIEKKTYSFSPTQGRYLRLIIDKYRADGSEAEQVNLYEIETNVSLAGATVSSNGVAAAQPANHHKILKGEGFDICDYVDNKGVKEVWLWMYHTDSVYPVESYQRGPGHEVGNGYLDLPLCAKSYTVYNYNYSRGLGEALEDHTHHLEHLADYLDHVLYWERFTGGAEEMNPGNKTAFYDNPSAVYRCGWTHCPPNVIIADCSGVENQQLDRCICRGYDWYNEREVLSDCEDWQPDGHGTTKKVNCLTWMDAFVNPDRYPVAGRKCPEDGGVAFKVWWLQNLPGKDNGLTYGGKPLRNFWRFVGDFDAAVAEGKCLTVPPC